MIQATIGTSLLLSQFRVGFQMQISEIRVKQRTDNQTKHRLLYLCMFLKLLKSPPCPLAGIFLCKTLAGSALKRKRNRFEIHNQ